MLWQRDMERPKGENVPTSPLLWLLLLQWLLPVLQLLASMQLPSAWRPCEDPQGMDCVWARRSSHGLMMDTLWSMVALLLVAAPLGVSDAPLDSGHVGLLLAIAQQQQLLRPCRWCSVMLQWLPSLDPLIHPRTCHWNQSCAQP